MPNSPFNWASNFLGSQQRGQAGQGVIADNAGSSFVPNGWRPSFMSRGGQQQQTAQASPPQRSFAPSQSFARPITGGGVSGSMWDVQDKPWYLPNFHTLAGNPTLGTHLQMNSFRPESGKTFLGQRTIVADPMQGLAGSRGQGLAGEHIAEALARDYSNLAGAREQLRNGMGGLISDVDRTMAMNQQRLDQARADADKAMSIGQQGYDAMMQQGQKGYDAVNQATARARAGEAQARKDMQGGIDTMQKAIADRDFFNKESISSGVLGIEQSVQKAKQEIMSNPNMTDEERRVEMDNLNNRVAQQRQAFASNAEQEGANALLGARSALANMQVGVGSNLASLNASNTSALGNMGLGAAQLGSQAASAAANYLATQHSFASGLVNKSIADAMQARLAGDSLKAQFYDNMPFGLPQIADTIIAMMKAQGNGPNSRVSGGVASLIGGLYR